MGELQKRILEEIGCDWDDIVFKDADYEKLEEITVKQILINIIDEACEDFPNLFMLDFDEQHYWKEAVKWYNKWLKRESQ